ncbi:putative metacaspase [Venturia nashicola]|uniref:Putative metacaspase n=1 Tax=Venturia nashicola TaxID=86259 RepID=A0A4Z1NVY2_9PEZI|nr:putative metacaspase [Venturia nashicola]TLD21682.1 putative metacaspase [Venturia nashicola]
MSKPRKSLLIGINYTGSSNQLRAEFLRYRGYSDDPRSQVILKDDREGPYYPSGHNILAAIDWLVSEPGTINFLHYSGHGAQVRDPTGRNPSGVLDTIVPVDYKERGQINSDTLHEHLVSRLPPSSTLFVILDCCHSGSALELPFVYRSDDDGNINMIDNVKEGIHLMAEATDLIYGGFSFNKLAEAQDLYAGATNFFRSFKHRKEQQEPGLGSDSTYASYAQEHKMVTMFSGCRDDQTSADANIGGMNEGAMSWAFLQTMKKMRNPTFIQALQDTRSNLRKSNYVQVPQLSIGMQIDLDQPLNI